MSNIVISVENLSKSYRLGQIGTGTLSHDINVWWAKVRGKPNPMLRIGEKDHGNREGETIWALKDINFTVEQGEVLGIIGRNGAGKSTLLKILSRVTAPTNGHARVKGRIASLLEVGTGFHPDLTGRENIYLNGAILGMSRKEIGRKLDEIVAFAEIEKFMDTPVKRYSSGMYVRLAFAVAAHLDPEILVVDEVLAVGDIQFQKKCLGKMGDVAHEGRTVLFVSHNMGSIRSLCQRGLLLDSGYIIDEGYIANVIDKYSSQSCISTQELAKRIDRKGSGIILCTKVSILSENFEELSYIMPNQSVYFKMVFINKGGNRETGLTVGLGIDTLEGERIVTLYSGLTQQSFNVNHGTISFLCHLENGINLKPGTYRVATFLGRENETLDFVENAILLEIVDSDFFGTGKGLINGQGHILLRQTWSTFDEK